MSAILADLLTVAKKVNNYKADATAGGIWTSTTTYEVVCPADKRWFLVGGFFFRSDSGTINVQIRDVADKIIHSLGVGAAAAGAYVYPCIASSVNNPSQGDRFIIDAGEYVIATFGVAQGATATGSCVVLEIDI